jgi:hypothetical protein
MAVVYAAAPTRESGEVRSLDPYKTEFDSCFSARAIRFRGRDRPLQKRLGILHSWVLATPD